MIDDELDEKVIKKIIEDIKTWEDHGTFNKLRMPYGRIANSL